MAHTNDPTPRTVRRTRRRRALAVAAAGLLLGLGAAGTAVAADDGDGDAPCSAAARACVDLESNQAWLMDDGEVTYGPVEVAHGGAGTETPTGDFEVYDKEADHHSAEFDAPMPWSVFFAPGGVAFHEGDRFSPSAGCVRLKDQDATVFYGSLGVGDRVEVR